MTPEDEEFSRIEMESRIRKEGVRAMKVEGALHVVCQCDKCKAQPDNQGKIQTVDSLTERKAD